MKSVQIHSKKKGFSMIELLIVLSIIAALIALIVPIAMNASQKARATEIAKNMKTLADSIERIALTDGVDNNEKIKGIDSLSDVARDVNGSTYHIIYYVTDQVKTFDAYIVHKGNNLFDKVREVLSDASSTTWSDLKSRWSTYTPVYLEDSSLEESDSIIYYKINFYIYQ
ncbi:MAG TPA: type II secretion system protein [Mesotoga infera]|uniref:Prepilin-type N-terminal cleavage/methylation domain-containing protein n=1 Tax=Mesotoga infera TaxID=1236046 RepID=A0A7Z7LD86_9BACT|nr:type II secretion system protein [Mesotoga infera]HRR43971.1 type II secretion system protein [Mesotoga sp.]SSC11515.1 conserved protein of unknown function [Mesotoga infera]HNS66883.1 type II secretion system protein [Mesotoga infera]HON28666.1 type II secretion system protein [Mesotoga infera]HPD37775.1 type II secretion system protein [Mesotoga infera]